jgi:hypothetical protein
MAASKYFSLLVGHASAQSILKLMKFSILHRLSSIECWKEFLANHPKDSKTLPKTLPKI